MDPLTGALVAAAAAFLSIVAVALLPVGAHSLRRLRGAGAASLALLGLSAFGFPLPGYLPVVVLAVGIAWSAIRGAAPAAD